MSAKLIDRYKAIQAIGTEIEIPFHVRSQFGTEYKFISIFGDQVSLGEDSATVEGARAAIQWYVEQLGGTVKWSKI